MRFQISCGPSRVFVSCKVTVRAVRSCPWFVLVLWVLLCPIPEESALPNGSSQLRTATGAEVHGTLWLSWLRNNIIQYSTCINEFMTRTYQRFCMVLVGSRCVVRLCSTSISVSSTKKRPSSAQALRFSPEEGKTCWQKHGNRGGKK